MESSGLFYLPGMSRSLSEGHKGVVDAEPDIDSKGLRGDAWGEKGIE